MADSRLPLTIRPVRDGFAIVFADGGQHVFIRADEPDGRRVDRATEDALELAKEVARALIAAWSDPVRSAA
jgi:hypothetical protein